MNEKLLAGEKEFGTIREAFLTRCSLREMLDYPLVKIETEVLGEIERCQELLKNAY